MLSKMNIFREPHLLGLYCYLQKLGVATIRKTMFVGAKWLFFCTNFKEFCGAWGAIALLLFGNILLPLSECVSLLM